jgi:hypothetical protein
MMAVMGRRLALGIPLIAPVVLAQACAVPGRMLRGYAEAEPDGMQLLEDGGVFAHASAALRGQVRFVFDDFGSLDTDILETYGVPLKLTAASVVLDRERSQGRQRSLETFGSMLEEYGFLRPSRIANWTGPQPRLDRALGLISGTAKRGFPAVEVEIGNLGCAACHAGPVFGPDGRPTGEAWLGLPNPSIDVTAYANEVFHAMRRGLEAPDTLLAVVATIFPDVSDREMGTLRRHVIPGAREELEKRAVEYGGLLPFHNGGPGLNNGVGSLRFLAGDDVAGLHLDASWASAPELSGTGLRRSVLIDGVYAAPGSARYGWMARDDVTDEHLGALAGVVSLFIVGTQGIAPERASAAIPRVHDVMRFVNELEPPPFPGHVDHALAERGAGIYRSDCAVCHGRYSPGTRDVRLIQHPNRIVAQERMLTDSLRWAAADEPSLRLLDEIGYRDVIEPLNAGGYVAPDLSGVWATAPYLHNGSVPTLWHLLNPDRRPERFFVGGHALDYERVGISGAEGDDGVYRYPDGYIPWSKPAIYDTREPGRSNAGHEFRRLSEEQRRALLEYMKVL